MATWLLRRLLILLVVLLGITAMTFMFTRFAPGDPVLMMVNPEFGGGGPEFLARKRAELGLDQSIPIQYGAWLREVVSGNLGFSFVDGRPVTHILFERFPETFKLVAASMLLAVLVGVPIGVLAALRQYSIFDYLATIMSLAVISTPSFFLALAAIYVLSIELRLLPTAGTRTPGGTSDLIDQFRHLLMPATILGLGVAGPLVRYTRAAVLEVRNLDFITTATSKGLKPMTIMRRHLLANALIPIITVIAIQIPLLFAGSVVIEQIYAWPGMGQLAYTALQFRDYPVLMGLTLAAAVLVLLSNLVADLAYVAVDPRVRLN